MNRESRWREIFFLRIKITKLQLNSWNNNYARERRWNDCFERGNFNWIFENWHTINQLKQSCHYHYFINILSYIKFCLLSFIVIIVSWAFHSQKIIFTSLKLKIGKIDWLRITLRSHEVARFCFPFFFFLSFGQIFCLIVIIIIVLSCGQAVTRRIK